MQEDILFMFASIRSAVRPAAYLNGETFIETIALRSFSNKRLVFLCRNCVDNLWGIILPLRLYSCFRGKNITDGPLLKGMLQMSERYRQKPEELYSEFNSSENGLTSQQAEKNSEKYGKNQISEGKKKSALVIFLEQFKDFLVIILIIAAIISACMGDVESMVVILVVITMNAILGTVQTLKAEKSLSNLKKLSSPNAKVMRNGEAVIIPSEEVTVGDVVLIEAGDQIPADGRLIECASVQVNESALTGESVNIDKSLEIIDRECALGDRINMVFSGSFVTYGRGKFIVTDIGMNTEVGKIASLIQIAE